MPLPPTFTSWSLKTKLALASGLLMFGVSVASTTWMLSILEGDVGRSVADTQMSLVRSTAQNLDEEINERRRSLMKTAAVLSRTAPARGAETAAFFNAQPVILDLFDALTLVDEHGLTVDDSPHLPGRLGVDLADRDYIRKIMAGADAAISSPLKTRTNGQPAIIIAAAMRGRDGRINGALLGTINLNRPNFLGALGDTRIGRNGHFVVIEKGEHPLIVMHGDKSRILTPAGDAQSNPQLARALAGFEGTLQGTNAAGVESLRSYVSLHNVPWVVGAVYPTEEAYAGLRARQREALWLGAGLFVLASLIARFVVGRLLRPLTELRELMARHAADPELPISAARAGSAELAAVIEAYQTQFATRREVENRLLASERRLIDITDNLPALVAYIDSDHRYRFANAKYKEWLGADPAAMIGRSVSEAVNPAFHELIRPQVDLALFGERVQWERQAEHEGRQRQYQVEYIPDRGPDGRVRGCYALTIDVTERHQAELAAARSEQRMVDLTNSIPAMVGYFDMQERCQYINDTGLKSHGLRRAGLPGISLRAAIGEANYAQHAPYVKEVLQGRRARFEGKVGFQGRAAHFQAHLVPDRIEGGEQRGFYLMTFDITALKEAQGLQAQVEQRLRGITDNLPVLISYVDDEQRFTFANATFKTWLGQDPADVIGQTVEEVIGAQAFAGRSAYIQRCLSGERVDFEIETDTLKGRMNLHSSFIPERCAEGTVVGFYSLSVDTTEQKAAQHQLSLLVRSDTLTGLANRYQFNETLPLAIARAARSGMALALVFLDIDHFKRINDQLGHAAGDEALKEFARRLLQSVRSTDTVARLAGDEFVVILESLRSQDEAHSVARKILDEVRHPFSIGGRSLAVTTSMGIVFESDSEVSATELLGRADAALYQAKESGRNDYRMSA